MFLHALKDYQTKTIFIDRSCALFPSVITCNQFISYGYLFLLASNNNISWNRLLLLAQKVIYGGFQFSVTFGSTDTLVLSTYFCQSK